MVSLEKKLKQNLNKTYCNTCQMVFNRQGSYAVIKNRPFLTKAIKSHKYLDFCFLFGLKSIQPYVKDMF